MKKSIKNSVSTPIVKTDKKVNEVSKINLSKFAEQLSKIEVKEKKKRETMYKYPEGFTEKDINSEKGKQYRNKCRNIRNRFANNILSFAKQNEVLKGKFDVSKLTNEVKEFNKFYKETYLLNDYSFKSISQAKEEDEKELVLFLSILKDIKK